MDYDDPCSIYHPSEPYNPCDPSNPCYRCESFDESKYKAPLPWIGIYVAAASLLCFLAIAADAFVGFRGKKLWFPCKFFALNAAWLTLLAVAMKMPLDISSPMPAQCDQFAKLSSTALLGVVIANFMPSLGPMDNKQLLTNIIALGIFVITVVANVCIQLGTTLIPLFLLPDNLFVIASVLLLLVILICSALNVPTTKKYLEIKYSDLQRVIASEDSEEIIERQLMTTEMLKGYVRKYWIMAETGSPQFAIARSITCSSSGAICSLIVVCIVLTLFRYQFFHYYGLIAIEMFGGETSHSDYKWSTFFILTIQIVAIFVGAIGPAFRWFTAVKFKCCPKKSIKTYITELKPERYWIEQLVEWKERPSLLQIRSKKCRKLVQGTNSVFLSLCIKFQIMVVVTSKLIILISVPLLSLFLLCHHYCKKLKKLLQKSGDSTNHTSSDSTSNTNLDPRLYVLSLEGEDELPESTLKSISDAVDHLILKSKKKQPKNLMWLLQYSAHFKMVATEFNSKELALLINSQEPSCCWTLSVVTLTAITVAIFNTKSKMIKKLIQSVCEGLSYVRLVEESMDAQGSPTSVRNAADKVWVGVEFHHRWLDQDLYKIALEGTSPKEILERLANNSVNEFKSNINGGLEDNPSNWPIEVIAANSMFRITKIILMDCEGNGEQTEEELFQKLYGMVGKMLGACLTKLPNVIIKKCVSSAIEKRLENVSLAVQLLGETEEILKILQQHEFSLSEC